MWSTVHGSILLLLLVVLIPASRSLKTIQAVLTHTVELPCTARQSSKSINPAKIVWIRDDRADIVSLDSVITVRDRRLSILTMDSAERKERTLRLVNIEEQDQGLYRCIQGDATLNEILLDVLVPPRIVSHAPEHMRMSVREGRDARFSCSATGRPPPSIVWHVNGQPRSAVMAQVAGQNESVLVLRNVSRFDSGRVDCSASNQLSTVNRQFLLHVKYKPIVMVPFHLSHFRLHDLATLTCQVCSIPSATLFDFFRPRQASPIVDGVKEKIDEFTNQTCKQLTLRIHLSDASLFGPYVCRARNALGGNHAECELKELMPSTTHATELPTQSSLPVDSPAATTSVTMSSTPSKRRAPSSEAVCASTSIGLWILVLFSLALL